ncbi:hypothetical protein [Maribacter halichondriae]|uniref:hypothetical protein n=1 Tax=Maribacter halichondriae TaxID=2980554 RepID=UPI002358C52E|nr:hypothetical protein [Maribacter sp. Hal144]
MKTLISLLLFAVFWSLAPELSKVRTDYREASNSEEMTKKLHDNLISVSKNDETVLVAYKGAITTMMSKYAEGIKDKKTFFKDGRELLEFAVETVPESVEIRCIRLSVQENAPKIVGYKKNIVEDKQFILDNYASMTDTGAKEFVKGYSLQSDAFSDAEKQLF